MKKFFTTLILFAAVAAQAQYLPNGGFDSWKTACGTTEAFGTGGLTSSKTGEMRQRPGVEPTDWNGSSINQKVVMQKKQELIYNENGVVKMQNTFVGVGSIGSVAPGFINLATPWVYAVSEISECDGGVYGGVSFTNKPDAIKGRYKRTDATGENSHIIVYLWNGNFTSNVGSKSAPDQARNNVDRAIIGESNYTGDGTLVAKCDYSFTSTTNNDWQEIVVPLEYVSDEAPEMMNTIISGGDYWTRANMKDGTTLYADDVQFVYYSRLASLTYNGDNYYKEDVDTYYIFDEYDASKLSYTLKGQSASANVAKNAANSAFFDEVTITVSNVGNDIDGVSTHTYNVVFLKAGYFRLLDANGNYINDGTPYYYNKGQFLDYKGGTWTNVADVDAVAFEAVESLPITISAAGYTAFYAPVAVEMPAGVTAHTVTINGDWATLSDPLDVVPAETGVVIAGNPGDYELDVVESDATVTDNALRGTVAADYIVGDAYVLSKPAGKEVGFYRATLNKLDGTAFYLSSHKSYLPASAAQGSAFYGLRIGGTTGITEVETAPAEDVIYDLTGRRVTKIVAPGIYIVNGVKKYFN